MTYEEVNEILEYDPTTGLLSWKIDVGPFGRIKAGTVAGSLDADGYVQIGCRGKVYKSHRLCWLIYYKEYPNDQIDHINRIRTDNRIENLRDVSCQQNHHNRSDNVDYIGVYERAGKFRAAKYIKGKLRHFGTYKTPQEAYRSMHGD